LDSVPNYVGDKGTARIDKRGLSDHPGKDKRNRKCHKAREYYRTSENISAIVVGVGGADSLGLEALPTVWEYGDGEVGVLPAASVVFDGAASCASSAAYVLWV
jgi:hypothetical protein